MHSFRSALGFALHRSATNGALSRPRKASGKAFLALLAGLCALTIFYAADARADALRIVAFGDSLMAGYNLPQSQGFPVRLQAALKAKGHDVTVVDAGVSGDTASAGLARIDWSVPDGTHGVILELGANDMLRGVSPAVTRKALDEMIGRLKQRKIDVMLAGMRAPGNLGPDYVAAFDSIYPDLAKKHGLLLYPFFLDGVALNEKLNLKDGVHPNAAGIDMIVQRILPTVEKFIERIRSQQAK